MSRGRRYDVDALRVIAIGFLLVYHTAICFQPWGGMIGFPVAPNSWLELWPAMTMLNVWRIPLLFFVSGMGLHMAMGQRTTRDLIKERLQRIGIPLLFGSLVIVPLQNVLLLHYYNLPISYMPGMAHLWFLANIIVYALVLVAIRFVLPQSLRQFLSKLAASYSGAIALLVLILGLLLLEVLEVHPIPFELFAFTLHGWVMGLIAFLGGFLLMASGEQVWLVLKNGKWIFLAGALILYARRIYPQLTVADGVWLSIESTLWIFGLFGMAYTYLNKPSVFLARWKDAAYPVYILHMVFLNLGSIILFPLGIPAPLNYMLLLFFVVTCSLATYWFVIKKVKWLRHIFGLAG